MCASFWSAVSTRGLDTTSPWPSDCRAESSRSMIEDPRSIEKAREPALGAAGRFTLRRLARAGIVKPGPGGQGVPTPGTTLQPEAWALLNALLSVTNWLTWESVPARVPEVVIRPLLVLRVPV